MVRAQSIILNFLALALLASVVLILSTYLTNTSESPHIDLTSIHIQNKTHFYERNIQHYDPTKVLLPYLTTAPDTIHILWCGNKWFEFKHYLSLVSVFKVQQPNKVIIHHWLDQPVLRDQNDYNMWYQDLNDEFYNIVTHSLGPTAPDCQNESLMMPLLMNIMKDGGIYINDSVILNQHLHSLRRYNVAIGVRNRSQELTYSNIAFLVMKKGFADRALAKADAILQCGTSDEWENRTTEAQQPCISVLRNYIPEKIMQTADAMSQKIRWLYYGSSEPKLPHWSMEDPIPNIGHMVFLGGAEMNMLTYLSIKSMIHCAKAEHMYIYIDQEPKGAWYEKLKNEEPRAVFVYHEWPQTVFGRPMADGSHASDLMRFDLIYRYGGIYVDWDAVMLKPLGDLRGYGFVTDFDWPDWHPPYPDVINNGVSAGKKGSEFVRKCLMKFKVYNANGDWYYNGLMVPYKLYEQYPELVKIERRLQVICYRFKCHPVWLPGYHDENIHHLNQASFDWREVYAFHWTMPSPPELLNMTLLMESQTMFAEVGRYILSCENKDKSKGS